MTYHAYRPQCHAFAFGGVGFGKNLVGDRLTGVIAHMHPSFGVDINGTVIRRMRQTPHVAVRDQEVTFDRLQIDMDVGLGFIIPPKPITEYSARVIADGAVAYWRLSETVGATTYDEIGGNNGAIAGAVTLGQASPIGGSDLSMAFAGGDSAITGGPVSLPAACSIEAWIKTKQARTDRAAFFSTRPANDPYSGLYLAYWYGGVLFWTQHGYANATSYVDDDKWHHIVITHDGTTGAIYIDGRLNITAVWPHVAETGNPNPVVLGHDLPQNEYFIGNLDEVAIYIGVLSPATIAAHYALAAPAVVRGASGPLVITDHPTMMLCYSNNGARKFGPELWRSVGKVGETDIQVAWSRLGTGKDRVFRLVATDPAPWRLVGAWLELEGS
jgi:hypothetical protein